jgi:menaquinone-specific isochorismate synthase
MADEYGGWESDAAPVQSPSPTYRSSADGRLVSLSMPSPGVSAAAFLALAGGQERFFWEDLRDDILFAGFGVAAHLLAWGPERFAHIEEQARALFGDALLLGAENRLAAPRLFGGFAFRDDFMPDNTWAVFHAAHFLLPHFQLVQRGAESWLTINALLPPEEREPDEEGRQALREELGAALQARYEWLRSMEPEMPEPTHGASGPPLRVNYPMSYEAWEKMIDQAVQQIETTPLQKVVLARVAELRFRERIDVNGALAYLARHYPDSYRFLFEPRPHHAFYGATPELLVRVEGTTLTTMAMAGSIRRSADPLEDAALGQELLNSAKDRHEHELVVMSLLERLAPVTSQLEISPQPGVYKLANIQHLLTPVRARLLAAQGVLPLVETLHPTPALGGKSRARAMAFIQEAEPVPRGWYAAPLGWIDVNMDGAFAVAIRSAVAQERRVWLSAGAGIVADSQPDKEWAETALKFRPMLEALGVEEGNGS